MGSQTKDIRLTRKLNHGRSSVDFFAGIHQDIISRQYNQLNLDLTEFQRISPAYAVLVASLPYIASLNGSSATIFIDPRNQKCNDFLDKSGIMHHYMNKIKRKSDKPMCIDNKKIHFTIIENEKVIAPTVQKILDNAPVEFSQDCYYAMLSRLIEPFSNAYVHNKANNGIFCCGYMGSSNIYYVSVYDAGVGIKRNVQDYLGEQVDSIQALEWALKEGNSTLNRSIDYPRGGGLPLLGKFLHLNGGHFDIVSSDAYGTLKSGEIKYSQMKNALAGTFVCIGIKSDNKVKYILKSEGRAE